MNDSLRTGLSNHERNYDTVSEGKGKGEGEGDDYGPEET